MNSVKTVYIDPNKCVGCGACIVNCPAGAIKMQIGFKSFVNSDKCVGCGKCVDLCHKSAPSFCFTLKT